MTDTPGNPADTPVETEKAKDDDKVDWFAEFKSISLLILGVLALHSFVVKPFYIPSESMMPGLLVGDRLVVSKYPYGWSFASPSFHMMPPVEGRLFGKVPERGDVVIIDHKVPDFQGGGRTDYIKRVIGLPGERFEVRNGVPYINGVAVRQEIQPNMQIPVDVNAPCYNADGPQAGPFPEDRLVRTANGSAVCDLPIVRETLPNGVSYDTINLTDSGPADNYGPITIPEGHLFLMGDNRDGSADSRAALDVGGLGGPVPWENIGGRAEFITFSMDGNAKWYNPISWFTAMRPGRAGTSLRTEPTAQK